MKRFGTSQRFRCPTCLQLMWVYFTCPENGQLYLRTLFSAVTYTDFSSRDRSNTDQTSELLELHLLSGHLLAFGEEKTFTVQFSPGKANLNMDFPWCSWAVPEPDLGDWLRKERHFCIAVDWFKISFCKQVKTQIFPLKIQERSLCKVLLHKKKYCPKHLTMYWIWASLIQPAPEAFPWAGQGLRGLGARQEIPERCEKGSTCSDWEKRKRECCSEFCHEQIEGAFQIRGNTCERNLPFLTLPSPGRICDPSSHFIFYSALFILSPIVMGQFLSMP